jgi:hypothetical protein
MNQKESVHPARAGVPADGQAKQETLMVNQHARVTVPDPDGAPLDDRGGFTRAGLFRMLATSAAGAAGVVLLADPSASSASTPAQVDLTILEYALTLEYLGAAFYESALQYAHLTGEAHAVALAFRGHERSHVRFVRATIKSLGGTPHAPETFDFGSATRSRAAFLHSSQMIEEMCVETLNGAGPLVTKPVLAGAGTLVSVEARQAAWVRDILGLDPAPFAFTPALTAAQSMARLHKLGFVK